jgi:hypothetical protein
MKVLNEYPGSHHYWREYEEITGVHCLSCGNDTLWEEQGLGDEHDGPECVCTRCGCAFTYHARMSVEPNEKNIVKQLKNLNTFEPTTPRGK